MSLTGMIAGLALAAAQQSSPPLDPNLPMPTLDPAVWWSPETSRPSSDVDPLYGRRLGRREEPIPIANGAEPLLYRLWGLQPLQNQLVRPGEMILEVWARPSRGVRQAVIRVTTRRDGRAFVQARAGLGCCTPEIDRRVDINAELPSEQIPALKALSGDAMWSQPRDVTVDYGDGSVSPVCLDGVAWDITLLVAGQARHLRRACDDAEVGSIARAQGLALNAAVGRDARFDAVFPRGADVSRQQTAYDQLIASGGQLKPAANARPQPPAVPLPPEDEPEDEAPAAIPPTPQPITPPSGR
ncbi:hypothetical protein ACN2C6_05045 [Caulobacter sp. ErkDOM-YI]|uniref:hypothetical protein n=1 Tax=unclassified Caulobacter TaxID=2648921 RepID=UPI003AF72CFF